MGICMREQTVAGTMRGQIDRCKQQKGRILRGYHGGIQLTILLFNADFQEPGRLKCHLQTKRLQSRPVVPSNPSSLSLEDPGYAVNARAPASPSWALPYAPFPNRKQVMRLGLLVICHCSTAVTNSALTGYVEFSELYCDKMILDRFQDQEASLSVIASSRLGPPTEEIHHFSGCARAARPVRQVAFVLVGICKLAVVLG